MANFARRRPSLSSLYEDQPTSFLFDQDTHHEEYYYNVIQKPSKRRQQYQSSSFGRSIRCWVALLLVISLFLNSSLLFLLLLMEEDGQQPTSYTVEFDSTRKLEIIADPRKKGTVYTLLKDADFNSLDHPPQTQQHAKSLSLSRNKEQQSHVAKTVSNQIFKTKLQQRVEENNPPLPSWMQQYVDWHQEIRKEIAAKKNAWKKHRYLILRCLNRDKTCGGLADRLRALPFLLQMAAMTERILLIHWERPAPLQEFLEPGSLDWTVPEQMLKQLTFESIPDLTKVQHVSKLTDSLSRNTVVDVRLQAFHEAKLYYDSHKVDLNDPDMDQAFGGVWQLFFSGPTRPIQQILDQFWSIPHQEPFQYVATQARTLYTQSASSETEMNQVTNNAIACAHSLDRSASTIFVASDSAVTSQRVLRTFESNANLAHVVVSPLVASGKSIPLHLDRGGNFLGLAQDDDNNNNESIYSPSDYYSVFVDLYLLAHANCISIDHGGFGKLGALLSGTQCYRKHRVRQCAWA